jgi:hypothetical protein
MTAAATLQRLALRRAQEWMRGASAVWTGEMKMARRGVRSSSALSDLRLRVFISRIL